MSVPVHQAETNAYASREALGKKEFGDLGLTRGPIVLSLSASARYVGAALVADGRVLRLFCQRLAKERHVAERAIRCSVTDILRCHRPAIVVIVAASDVEAHTAGAIHGLLMETCRAIHGAVTCMDLGALAHAHGVSAESVTEVARFMAANDSVVAAYLTPRGHGPRSDAERYWEHAALAAAAGLSISHL